MEEIIRKCLPTYEVVDKLGEGVYGSVFRIRDRFKERAVKIVPIVAERSISQPKPEDLDSQICRDFHSVREYYAAIRGKGVIDIYDFHLIDKQVSKHNAKAYLVILMELYPENLQDHVLDHFPLDPLHTLTLMQELAEILDRLSRPDQSAFLVTDLKPSNLLLTDAGHLVIGDLGGLKRLGSVSTMAGSQFSPSWCAPEIVLSGQRPQIPAAVYAYGLVGYFLWEGRLPYEDQDFNQRARLIEEKGLDFAQPHVPRGARDLIRRCLAFDAASRFQRFADICEYIRDHLLGRTTARSSKAAVADATQSTRTYCAPEGDAISTDVAPERPRASATAAHWTDPMLGMVFVRVPGGQFDMGRIGADAPGQSARPSARPATVEDFWMARHPVTQGQWEAVMGRNPSHFNRGESYPVEQVSWNDAILFVKKLTGLYNEKYAFWLPSESQWEYAARSGGCNEIFSGGSDPDAVAWYRDNSDFSSHPVGEKAPNALGLYDMSGNVEEWCADVFQASGVQRHRSTAVDGSGSAQSRVCRGGSWAHPADRCRTTARRGYPSGLRYTSLGFRIVRLD